MQKESQVISHLSLLGATCLKDANKMSVKLTPDLVVVFGIVNIFSGFQLVDSSLLVNILFSYKYVFLNTLSSVINLT